MRNLTREPSAREESDIACRIVIIFVDVVES